MAHHPIAHVVPKSRIVIFQQRLCHACPLRLEPAILKRWRWCENATALTGTEWQYLKVAQKKFMELQPGDFEDLLALMQ